MRRTPLLAFLICALALLPAATGTAAAAPKAAEAPQAYIVMFEDEVKAPGTAAAQQVRKYRGDLMGVYKHAFKGYSARLTPGEATKLAEDPTVASVEPDATVVGFQQDVPTGVRRIFADDNPNLGIGGGSPVTIDVDAAVIDTGIAQHPDLDIASRTNCTSGSCVDGTGNDGNGHGTHVAGTIGAVNNDEGVVGVAPGARLHSVKVLNDQGSGTLSAIAAGIDWVTARADTIEVANMSLGCNGCSSSAISTAISNSVDAGVVHVVAAGNSSTNASTFFPANHADVVTVSALTDIDGEPGGQGGNQLPCRSETDQDDSLAFYSNYGSVVEVAAPGTCIPSTWTGGGYNSISGTSMASPHVAGAASLLASADNKPGGRADVEAIRQKLIDTGNSAWTDDSGDGTKEPLLDVHDDQEYPPGEGTGNRRPAASFTESCDEDTLACSFDGTGSSDPDGSVDSYEWDFGDGGTGTGSTADHTYAEAGTYTVTLTVTDNEGATGTTSKEVQVGPPPSNQPPSADFTQQCTALWFWRWCDFDAGGSSDADGTVESYAWQFGDGSTGTGATPATSTAPPGATRSPSPSPTTAAPPPT